MKGFGFTKKDVDEVKGIFSESNLYLLCGTMLIASVHVNIILTFNQFIRCILRIRRKTFNSFILWIFLQILFDFLSFKNDIAFWNKRKSYVGLSMRTTLWRTFSQIVIFLYLLDQHTSMLVLVPAFISTVIEVDQLIFSKVFWNVEITNWNHFNCHLWECSYGNRKKFSN